jgi:hypothetical protein
LSGTQFSTLNGAGSNDSEGPGKYNKNEVKYGATFLQLPHGTLLERYTINSAGRWQFHLLLSFDAFPSFLKAEKKW